VNENGSQTETIAVRQHSVNLTTMMMMMMMIMMMTWPITTVAIIIIITVTVIVHDSLTFELPLQKAP